MKLLTHDGFGYTDKTRKLDLPKKITKHVDCAYLGGGEGWDHNETPAESILCIIFKSDPDKKSCYSKGKRQSVNTYDFFFDYYNLDGLKVAMGAERAHVIDGGAQAQWEVWIPLNKKSNIDSLIIKATKWHAKEMARVRAAKKAA